MVSRTEVERLRQAQGGIGVMVRRDLAGFWSSLNLNRPERARDALLAFVPALVQTYGESAAVVAADWYDEQRAMERVPGRFRAAMAAPPPTPYVQQRVRFAAQHLFTDAPGQMLAFLDGAAEKYALQAGRDTIQQSSVADPRAVGWHRETRPSESFVAGCGFCNVLAGRGGVYKWETAPFAAHDDCHCVAVPSWDANAEEVPVSAYVASTRTVGMTPEERDEHFAQIRDLAALEGERR